MLNIRGQRRQMHISILRWPHIIWQLQHEGSPLLLLNDTTGSNHEHDVRAGFTTCCVLCRVTFSGAHQKNQRLLPGMLVSTFTKFHLTRIHRNLWPPAIFSSPPAKLISTARGIQMNPHAPMSDGLLSLMPRCVVEKRVSIVCFYWLLIGPQST